MNDENQEVVYDSTATYQETNNFNGTSQAPTNSNKSLISLILGIVGFFVMGLPCGIAAIILSCSAKKDGSYDGKATAGLVLGIIDVIKAIVIVIIYVLYIIFTIASLQDIY